MTTKPTPRQVRPKTFCPACRSRGIIVVKVPEGSTLCFPCTRAHKPTVYQNIVHWVIDHPPITQEEPAPGG